MPRLQLCVQPSLIDCPLSSGYAVALDTLSCRLIVDPRSIRLFVFVFDRLISRLDHAITQLNIPLTDWTSLRSISRSMSNTIFPQTRFVSCADFLLVCVVFQSRDYSSRPAQLVARSTLPDSCDWLSVEISDWLAQSFRLARLPFTCTDFLEPRKSSYLLDFLRPVQIFNP